MNGPSSLALMYVLTAASIAQAQPNAASEGPPAVDAVPTEQAAPQPYAPTQEPSAYPVPYPAPYATRPPDAYPPPYGFSPAAVYETTRRSAGLAFLIEFFLPGGGSIYGDHLSGALITWGLELGGIYLMFKSGETVRDPYTGASETKLDGTKLAIGLLLMLGGRTYGLVDSILATRNYNERLRKQLGLAAHLSLDPILTANGGHILAPALRLSF